MLLLRLGLLAVFAAVSLAAEPDRVVIKLPENRRRAKCNRDVVDNKSGGSKVQLNCRVYTEPNDFHLLVGDRSIYAHKRTITSAIPYFAESGSVESKIKDLLAENLHPRAIESMFRFAYTSKLNIHPSNAESLLKAARFLKMTNLISVCTDYLLDSIDDHNVVNIVNDVKTGRVLRTAGYKYIQDHFSSFSLTSKFVDISEPAFLTIMRSNEIRNTSEERVFEGAIRWIQHNENDRNKYIYEIMENVRLALIPETYFIQNVVPKFVNNTDVRVRKLIKAEKYYHFFPEERTIHGCNTWPRDDTTTFISIPYNEKKKSIQSYDATTHELQNITQTPAKIHSCAMMHDCNVLIIGGNTGNTSNHIHSNLVDVYNPRSNSWDNIEPMIEKRIHPSAVGLNGIIYVCGGFSGHPASKTTESYNPYTKTWTYLASMSKLRYRHRLLAFDDNLYAIGGFISDTTIDKSVEKYDISRNVWTNVKPMLNERSDFGAAVLDGKLYVCGGRPESVSDLAEVYDPTKDVWTPIEKMLTKKTDFSLVAYHGQLWAFHGWESASTEVYDPETDSWTQVPNYFGNLNKGVWETLMINY